MTGSATGGACGRGDEHMNGHVQDELAALVAGELSPSAAAAVHVHLATCDQCRVELAAVAFATGELRAAARLPFADPDELPPLNLPVTEAERVGPAAVVLAATDDGLDPAYQATRQAAFAVAAREGARVVLFDRSPELYLVDPYERARANGGPRSSLLSQRTASRVGRAYLAE